MSSVEIRIKGIKNVRGLKTKRGKAKRKAINKKKQLAEKKKMEEYSYSMNRPYNYTSPIIPTYITRPDPIAIQQPQQQQIDYKPLFDKLALSMRLASDKENKVEEQNIKPPPVPPFPSEVKVEEVFTQEDIDKEKREKENIRNLQQKIRKQEETKWFSEKKTYGGFNDWWKKNKEDIFRQNNIAFSEDRRKKSKK